jgi:pimeloyl-ACP methyl ester carboxylesterase
MAEWPGEHTHANGIDIHYHRTGGAGTGKPPLILLHGITDNGLCWTRVARDLRDSYDVIMPDARGHGQTGGSVEGFSVKLLADDAAALIRALGLEKPYLFGHSMGAATAMVVAANYPDLVRAIVLEDPPFGLKRSGEQIEQRLQQVRASKTAPRQQLIAQVRADNPHWVDEEIDPWADSKAQVDPGVVYLRHAESWQEVLARITCPILLITADPQLGALVTPEQAEQGMQLCKSGEVVRISNAGHSIHRDRYGETMEAVRDFLRRNA